MNTSSFSILLGLLSSLGVAACSAPADDAHPVEDGSGGSGGSGGSAGSVETGGAPANAGSGGTGGTSEDDCYSPTQNFANAYDPDAVGCPCDGEPAVCVGGTALTCRDGHWDAVEDGPCMPTADDCASRASEAHRKVSEAIEASDLTCATDEDCIVAGQETNCWSGCFGAAISTLGKSSVDAAVADINANECANFEHECPGEYLVADFSLPDDYSICVESKCRLH